MPEPMALESAIAALRDTPKILAALIDGAPDEVLCRKPAPGNR